MKILSRIQAPYPRHGCGSVIPLPPLLLLAILHHSARTHLVLITYRSTFLWHRITHDSPPPPTDFDFLDDNGEGALFSLCVCYTPLSAIAHPWVPSYPPGCYHTPWVLSHSPWVLSHPLRGYHTPMGAITPPWVLLHPLGCYHTPMGAMTPPWVLSHPLGYYHTPMGAITPPWVLSHTPGCYHTPLGAIISPGVISHPPGCYHTHLGFGETRLGI